jgi:hypothetical protein
VLVAVVGVKTHLRNYESPSGAICKRLDLYVYDESDCIVTLILWRDNAERYAQTAHDPRPVLFLKQVQLLNGRQTKLSFEY